MTPTLLADLKKFRNDVTHLITLLENQHANPQGFQFPPPIPPPSGPRDVDIYHLASNLRDELLHSTGVDTLEERFQEFAKRLDELHHLNGYKRALGTWKTALQPFMVAAIIKHG